METIKIIEKKLWHFSKTNEGSGGLVGQVSKCRFEGVVFYVRENVTGIDSFTISFGDRWGDKIGSKPSPGRQVLEILAPKHFIPFLKRKVTESDQLKRRVITNSSFNKKFIDSIFKQNSNDRF